MSGGSPLPESESVLSAGASGRGRPDSLFFELSQMIIPAATVSLVPGSMRMNDPVMRLRR